MLRRDGITSEAAHERAQEVHEKTWAALEQYRGLAEQRNWWPDFVRSVLRRESAVADRDQLAPLKILGK